MSTRDPMNRQPFHDEIAATTAKAQHNAHDIAVRIYRRRGYRLRTKTARETVLVRDGQVVTIAPDGFVTKKAQ